MPEVYAHPWWGNRAERPDSGSAPEHRALVVPGRAYSVDMPLLHWSCHALVSAGWWVQVIRWQPPDDAGRSFVDEAVRDVVGSEPPGLVLGKSLGTYAARWAGRTGTPGIWLTPLVTDASLVEDLRGGLGLLVGGSADPSWDGEAAASTGLEVLEVAGADHGLEVASDWRASTGVHVEVAERVERFASGVAAGH